VGSWRARKPGYGRILALGALLVFAVVGCRTSSPHARVPQPEAVKSSRGGASLTAPRAVWAAPSIESPAPRPTEVNGYGLDGAVTCVALAPGRHCIQRVDPLTEACAKANGEVLRCVDCRSLCSKEVHF